MADQLIASRWLLELAGLVRARLSHDETADFVTSYARPLASRFPNEALTEVSAEAVAADCLHLPAYGEIVAALRIWWRDNQPLQQALPPPPIRQRDEPTEDEHEHVKRAAEETIAWLRQRSRKPEAAPQRPQARHFSRELLNHLYQRQGLTAPQVPTGPPPPANDPGHGQDRAGA